MADTTTETGAFEETVVFLRPFKDLADPRQQGKVSYPLDEILLLCLFAALAGRRRSSTLRRSAPRSRGFCGGSARSAAARRRTTISHCLIQECSRAAGAFASPGCSRRRIAMSTGGSTGSAFLFDWRNCFPIPTWQRRSRGAQRREWEERSHPEPRTARSSARGWRAPDLPRSERRGKLPANRDQLSPTCKRYVTKLRSGQPSSGIREDRCLPWRLNRKFALGLSPKSFRSQRRDNPARSRRRMSRRRMDLWRADSPGSISMA